MHFYPPSLLERTITALIPGGTEGEKLCGKDNNKRAGGQEGKTIRGKEVRRAVESGVCDRIGKHEGMVQRKKGLKYYP